MSAVTLLPAMAPVQSREWAIAVVFYWRQVHLQAPRFLKSTQNQETWVRNHSQN